MPLEVELEQPEEGMLRQEEAHTQGKELPALQCNTHNTQPLTTHRLHQSNNHLSSLLLLSLASLCFAVFKSEHPGVLLSGHGN